MATLPSPAGAATRQTLIGEALWPRRERTRPVRYHAAEIALATPVEIAEGILLARLPLPFALNHINVYLVEPTSVVPSGAPRR